jgi:hypothetical protein
MKLVLLFYTLLLSTSLTAQLIEIKVKKTQHFVVFKKTSGAKVLKNAEFIGEIENKTAFFVVDLNRKECKYIENGEEISETKIKKIKQKGSIIHLTLKEYRDGLPIYIFHKRLDIYSDAGVVCFTSFNSLYGNTRVELMTEAEVIFNQRDKNSTFQNR